MNRHDARHEAESPMSRRSSSLQTSRQAPGARSVRKASDSSRTALRTNARFRGVALLISALLAFALTSCTGVSSSDANSAPDESSSAAQTMLADTSSEESSESDASGSSAANEGPNAKQDAEAEQAGAEDSSSEAADAEIEPASEDTGTEAVGTQSTSPSAADNASTSSAMPLTWDSLPAYDGSPYVYVNDGEPTFSSADRKAAYGTEIYGDLDKLGRCTDAFAVVGPETQPTEKRGSIGSVKPSGWQLAKYDFVDGKYLFNRCHLLGYQLTGENANVCNLITGTRYLNIDGMLPFENAVDDYVDATGNHVLMRVTPIFAKKELVARGVQMQAESLEDQGDGISFNVFCYNVQPGVIIDYATGDNKAAADAPGSKISSDSKKSSSSSKNSSSSSNKGNSSKDNAGTSKSKQDYVLNTNTKKFHVPSCSSVKQMADKNREDVKDTRENILNRGYDPCKRCNP